MSGPTAERPLRRLLLLRHAQAAAGLGTADHDRELTDAGRRQAADVGRWLHEQGLGCDLVLCSTAVRTRRTWELAAQHGASAAAVEHRRGIYAGGLDGVLETVREEGDLGTILVVGHAPTLPILASLLTDGAGSAAAQTALAQGFPPAAVAVLRYAGRWADLGPGCAALADFYVGRG